MDWLREREREIHSIFDWYLGMEECRHDIVVVSGQDRDTRATLPVPDANRLVVRGRDDPRALVMHLHRADVVQVAQQREQASTQLVVPHFDLVVVTARHEQRLRRMEADATNGAWIASREGGREGAAPSRQWAPAASTKQRDREEATTLVPSCSSNRSIKVRMR